MPAVNSVLVVGAGTAGAATATFLASEGIAVEVVEVRRDRFAMRAPDANCSLLAELPELRSGGPDVPSVVGMFRPDLARILVARAGQVGARIRFGTACAGLEPAADGVGVAFTDGSAGRYDLVVGADGIRSSPTPPSATTYGKHSPPAATRAPNG